MKPAEQQTGPLPIRRSHARSRRRRQNNERGWRTWEPSSGPARRRERPYGSCMRSGDGSGPGRHPRRPGGEFHPRMPHRARDHACLARHSSYPGERAKTNEPQAERQATAPPGGGWWILVGTASIARGRHPGAEPGGRRGGMMGGRPGSRALSRCSWVSAAGSGPMAGCWGRFFGSWRCFCPTAPSDALGAFHARYLFGPSR